MPDRWVTFDCFGTLVDWHAGFTAVLAPLLGSRTEDVLREYHRHERVVEAERPHRLYKDVLVESLMRASASGGSPLSETQARMLPQAWGTLPVFSDVENLLAELRGLGIRLGVLTNCDEDLFRHTQRCFRQPFDRVVTAEQVCDYKPSLSHFRFFWRTSGVEESDWIHVACSWFHDIAPARELGIRRVWLDRDETGDDPAAASAHVRTGPAACAAIRTLFGI